MKRTIIIECKACSGTGLHKNNKEESGGAAVECRECSGTGKTEFTYTEFEGRKEMKGITRVFPLCASDHNYQHFHTDKDYETRDGKTLHFSQYGCSYEDWKNGVKPAPMEEIYCPAEYCLNDTTDIERTPCSRCESGASIGGCLWYDDKAKCWEEWHKNND